MVRLWTWEALAHGAEVVSYFRWRQAPFAQEQFHAGLNLPGLNELAPGGAEAAQVARELAAMPPLPETRPANVAFVFDYPSYWATMIQPQGRDFRYEELVFRWYEEFRRLGLDIDVVPPGAPLQGYDLVVVPTMVHVTDAARAAIEAADGMVLIGPRAGSRDRTFAIPENLAPGPLAGLTGTRVTQVASLRPGLEQPVTGSVQGGVIRWRDHVTADSEVLARFADDGPALTRRGRVHVLHGWPAPDLLEALAAHMAEAADLQTLPLPPQIRLRRRGNWWMFFNYGPGDWTLPLGFDCLLGGQTVPPQGLTIAQRITG
jgi:beta-galactosidase